MDTGAKNWLYKTAHKNHWRVSRFYEIDDLIQDGFLCYYRVRQHYPDAVDPPHIMRLFQRTFTNHIHDLATRQTRAPDLIAPDAQFDSTTIEHAAAEGPIDLGDAYIVPDTAPTYVKRFLQIMASADGPKRLRVPYRRYANGAREKTHARLCHVLGLSPEETPELPSAIETYLRAV